VRWVLGILAGYVLLMVLIVAIMQYAARADARPIAWYPDPTHRYYLGVYRDFPLPFHLGGGDNPGTVRLFDEAENQELDRERIDNVFTVHDVRWDPYEVTFVYGRGGADYRIHLRIVQ